MKEKKLQTFYFSQMSFMNRYFFEEDIFSYPVLQRLLSSSNHNGDYKELHSYLAAKRIPAIKTKDVFQVIEEQRGVVKNQHRIIQEYNDVYAIADPDLSKR